MSHPFGGAVLFGFLTTHPTLCYIIFSLCFLFRDVPGTLAVNLYGGITASSMPALSHFYFFERATVVKSDMLGRWSGQRLSTYMSFCPLVKMLQKNSHYPPTLPFVSSSP